MTAVTRGLKRPSRRLGSWSRSWEAKEKTRTARVFCIGLVGVLSDASPAAVARPPGSAEVWAEGPAWTAVAGLAVIAAVERAVTRAEGPAWTAVGALVLIRAEGLAGTAVGAPVLTAAEGPVATRVEELAEAGARVAPQAGESVEVGFAAAAEPDEPAAAFE